MKRNCNLELRLLPPSVQSFNPSSHYDDTQYHNSSSSTIEQEEQQKQMTIFYKGQMVVSDVTQLQARTIIMLASRETGETLCLPMMSNSSSSSPTTPLMQPHTPSPTCMSMKRSLQRFLQKRNNRVQAASPYYHH